MRFQGENYVVVKLACMRSDQTNECSMIFRVSRRISALYPWVQVAF